jgi:SAM-dependent methyltransferase
MATIAAPAREPYETFARFYDAFTAASDYEDWTAQVVALAERYGWTGNTVLDVACGTGNSLLPFARRGFEVVGCDLSSAMLAEAAAKAPDVRLVEADMRALPSLGDFDLVTCFDDSLNHLGDEDELALALGSMARNLGAAGLLLFDLNTLLAYRTTFALDSVAQHGQLTFALRGESSSNAPPGCRASVHVDVFAEREDGLCDRMSTRLEQRHFAPHRVIAALARAGLDCLGAHGVLADGSPVPEVDETRHLKALYVARLAKGGDPENEHQEDGQAGAPGSVVHQAVLGA